MAGIVYGIRDGVNDYSANDDDEDDLVEGEEDTLEDLVEIRAEKPQNAPADVVDMSSWPDLENYLRQHFQVHETVLKLALVLKYYKKGDREDSPSL